MSVWVGGWESKYVYCTIIVQDFHQLIHWSDVYTGRRPPSVFWSKAPDLMQARCVLPRKSKCLCLSQISIKIGSFHLFIPSFNFKCAFLWTHIEKISSTVCGSIITPKRVKCYFFWRYTNCSLNVETWRFGFSFPKLFFSKFSSEYYIDSIAVSVFEVILVEFYKHWIWDNQACLQSTSLQCSCYKMPQKNYINSC